MFYLSNQQFLNIFILFLFSFMFSIEIISFFFGKISIIIFKGTRHNFFCFFSLRKFQNENLIIIQNVQ